MYLSNSFKIYLISLFAMISFNCTDINSKKTNQKISFLLSTTVIS